MAGRSRLSRFTLRGFKSIRELREFAPGSLTVLIGPNGAGKSNLLSFFRMLSRTLPAPGNLQTHVAECGGASAILHDGPAAAPELEAILTLAAAAGENDYSFRLTHAAGDTLIFADERYRFSGFNLHEKAPWTELGAGHREAQLIRKAEAGDRLAGTVLSLLNKIVVHQFHNTSTTARIRNKWRVDDSRRLKEDAANLGPVLHRLRVSEPRYYQRIVETIRLILPFFADFELEPEHGSVLLSWRERNSDLVFDASQAADGMIRAMALVTLLLQPEGDLPDVLIIDEPELGLHPYAVEIVSGLVRAAATEVQVILATQSACLIDHFEPEEIVVVERKNRESIFRRLDGAQLKDWLEEYTVSELWDKNVLGGRPA